MKLLKLVQSTNSAETVNIQKHNLQDFIYKTVWLNELQFKTIIPGFDIIFNSTAEYDPELVNTQAEILYPYAMDKIKEHLFIGDCLVVKTKPFNYRCGVVMDRIISCTEEDCKFIKEFLQSR